MNNVSNKDNDIDEIEINKEQNKMSDQRIRRKAVVIGELKRKFDN